MEAFGVVVSRPIPSISGGTGVEPQPRNASLSGLFSNSAMGTQRNLRASRKSLKLARVSTFVFSDQSYLDYYSSGRKIRCGASKEKVKKEKEMKKRLKMLKGLSRDLVVFSEMGSDPDNTLVDPVQAKMISEAAELLQGQLQQLWSQEKELKQRRKEEESRLKAAKMQNMVECEMSSSSSSSSESSDSDCNVNILNCNARAKQIPDASQPIPEKALPSTSIQLEGTPDDSQAPTLKVKSVFQSTGNSAMGRGIEICLKSGSLEQGWPSGISSISRDSAGFTGSKTPLAKKVEVCMGGKCKKSGAAVLMEEFQRKLGIEGGVSGCKCMGKCRDGPNVRISNNFDEDMRSILAHGHVKPATNHLCIGVGLEDVDLIVDNFLGGSKKKFDLAAAS